MLFGKFVPGCIRSNLRGSKFKIFWGGGGEGYAPSTHTCLRMLLSSCYHPVSPPNSKSCMKPWTLLLLLLLPPLLPFFFLPLLLLSFSPSVFLSSYLSPPSLFPSPPLSLSNQEFDSLRRSLLASLGQLQEEHQRMQTRVHCCMAGTLVTLTSLPPKLNPIIRPLMDCIKTESDTLMQVERKEGGRGGGEER